MRNKRKTREKNTLFCTKYEIKWYQMLIFLWVDIQLGKKLENVKVNIL